MFIRFEEPLICFKFENIEVISLLRLVLFEKLLFRSLFCYFCCHRT